MGWRTRPAELEQKEIQEFSREIPWNENNYTRPLGWEASINAPKASFWKPGNKETIRGWQGQKPLSPLGKDIRA